ncbi:hypothetical protein AGMMS49960_04510 [Betaproteobacteria bacterium]|nr:hypothetical protein AGMMS49543_15290 [Betaproteobacteria bacterium]GHT99390.1 hypothetical protein AGMMS49960_04510 [Betaproteobacteria bacterium]GHU23217.1 hypothetical protein AGMMS50243_24230 [Betaproteobacteria bacterium]
MRIPACGLLHYTERLTEYQKITHTINGHEFVFIVEKTRADYYHACSVADVAFMLAHIPAADYGDLCYIVFRQPKRKEYLLSPVWGRLQYIYEFKGIIKPAIILEALPSHHQLKWGKHLGVEDQNEMERLKKDGHVFVTDKRSHTARLTPETVRATQLYRTLPHEMGHYVQYQQIVSARLPEFAEMPEEERENYFFERVPKAEKEKFAHAYADRLRESLLEQGVIPFGTQRGSPNTDRG